MDRPFSTTGAPLIYRVFARTLIAAAALLSISAVPASAADLFVDDDRDDCPAAAYSSIQSAIDVADTGDTVVICPGDYAEGPGTPGSNALTITRSIDIKGAGADLVTIRPRALTPAGGQIAANQPNLRDPVGNIVTVYGAPSFPIDVNISGVTISGGGREDVFPDTNIWNGEFVGGVYAETGLLFLDSGGSVSDSRITNIVTSERAGAESQPGGYRSNPLGYAIAQVTAATSTPLGATARDLSVSGTRIDRYNKGGILVDGATGESFPLTPAGVSNRATVVGTSIVGRNLNSPPNDGTGGGDLLTTGNLFGQDGIRVTAGSSLDATSSSITQNLMAGAGSNTAEEWPGAAGVRLVGAAASAITESNILENSYGVVNVDLDGTTANTTTPATATDDFWGYPVTSDATNDGPAVSPATLPTLPSNPVNGAADPDFGSDAVHFLPFRDGAMADPSAGAWPIQDSPLPVGDEAPQVTLTADPSDVPLGGNVKLTADASDDFGVSEISFYDGSDEIGSIRPPADSIVFTPPEVCGERTVGVLVRDSSGQYGTDELSINVVDPQFDCTDGPTVALNSPPTTIPQAGATFSATAEGEAGLGPVEFYLGERKVCSVATAPYGCRIVPNGSEIGGQVVRVAAKDTKGRSAVDSVAVEVAKFRSNGLALKLRRIGNKKKIFRKVVAWGSLKRPARMSAAIACSNSRITLIARQGGRQILNRTVELRPNCGYKTSFNARQFVRKKIKRGKRKGRVVKRRAPVVRVVARFPGNASLEPTQKRRNVR